MIGRFTSVDPHLEKYQTLSPFRYVAENPLKYVDEDGRDIRYSINNETYSITINIIANLRGNVSNQQISEWRQGVNETYSRILGS